MHYYHEDDLARFGEIGQHRPDLFEKFMAWYTACQADGALTRREKALIGLAVAHARPERVERPVDACRSPAPRRDRRRQGSAGDAAGAAIDKRRELLRVGVRVAPVAEKHGGCRTAAERLGLREVRDVERHLRLGWAWPAGSLANPGNCARKKKERDERDPCLELHVVVNRSVSRPPR